MDGTSRNAQHCYSVPGFHPEREEFSSALDPLSELPHDDYYTSQPALYGNEFAIPDSLNRTLDRIFQLPDESQRRFLRAAHWYFAANAVWRESASAAFISTIAALESLITRPMPGPKCPDCGRDSSPGPTRLFREFLDTYVSSSERMRKVANVLYTVRSNLAHGEDILLSDTEPFGRFDTVSLREFETAQDLYQVSRVAIINWLYEQDVA